MAETGDDETSHGPPPRPSPPKRKRESLVIQGRASEAGPLGAPAAAPWGRRGTLAVGALVAALALVGVGLFAARSDLAPLDRRAAALEAGANEANARLAALETTAKAAAEARKAAAEARDAFAAHLKAASVAEAKLADRVAALQAASDQAAAGSRDLPSAIKDLQSAVEALKHGATEESTRLKTASEALATRLATLEGAALRADALNAVAAEAGAAKQAADKALAAAGAPSDPRLDRLAADEAEIAALHARLDKLVAPKAVTRVSPSAPTVTADPNPAARLATAMALQNRLDAGAPLGALLAALDRLGVAADALAPLRPYAETGAPTLAALARGLDQARPQPHVAAGARGGLAQRLLGEVQGLVSVRKVGESRQGEAGQGEADLSRVEAALGAGDLAGALAAFAALSPATQAAARSWRDSAEARLAAGRAVEAIFGRAVADLGARR